MKLVYRDDRGMVRSFPLDGRERSTIGREAGRDLVLGDRRASRLHATIEHVGGAFLLRDAESANGTFLNGLRLSGANAIALREGDVVEIGRTRLFFGREGAEPTLTVHDRGETLETFFPLEDLIQDGMASLHAEQAVESDSTVIEDKLTREVSSRFLGVSPARGLERTLDLLQGRLKVDVAAVFLRMPGGEKVAVLAARPTLNAAHDLERVADRVWAHGGAYLSHASAAATTPEEETLDGAKDKSYAAAPFSAPPGAPPVGLLGVERLSGARLDRKDLAFLSVLGERIGRALGSRTRPEDTPISDDGGGSFRVGSPRNPGLAAS